MAQATVRRSPTLRRKGRDKSNDSVEQATAGSPSSVTKALRTLERVAANPKPIGVRELARELGYGKSTTSRILLALESEGYLEFDENSAGYTLSNKILQLASLHISNLRIHESARPHMLEALEKTGETVFLGVRDGWNVVVLDRVDSPQPLRMVTELGALEPAYCTGLGKVLLAFTIDLDKPSAFDGLRFEKHTPTTIADLEELKRVLRTVREDGYAFDDGEMFEGVRCVACPVYSYDGRVIAAVSVSGPTFRMGNDRIEKIKQAVKTMADKISTEFGAVK